MSQNKIVDHNVGFFFLNIYFVFRVSYSWENFELEEETAFFGFFLCVCES